MTDERRQRILQIADDLESQGLPATNSLVYYRALGYRGDVVTVMKTRRAERVAAGDVAVIEEDEEPEAEEAEIPAAVLAEDLAQLEAAYEGYHLALEKLWDLEREGVWDEAISNRQTFLEKTLVKNLQQQERLRPALERATLREAALRGRDQHDAGIPAARAMAQALLEAVVALQARLVDVKTVFAVQVDGLVVVRDRRNHQAFSDLVDGDTEALRLLSAFFPNDPRAKALFDLLMGTDLTKEVRWAAALAGCPRLQPFSESTLNNYLNTLTEGTSNGHP